MCCTSEGCQLATALKLEFQLMIQRRTLQLIIHPHIYCIMKQTFFFFFYKTHIITITQLLQFALVFNPIKRPQYSFGPPLTGLPIVSVPPIRARLSSQRCLWFCFSECRIPLPLCGQHTDKYLLQFKKMFAFLPPTHGPGSQGPGCISVCSVDAKSDPACASWRPLWLKGALGPTVFLCHPSDVFTNKIATAKTRCLLFAVKLQ